MTSVKIPADLLEGVLYALDQVQYSGEWYEYARSHGQPDRPIPDNMDFWPRRRGDDCPPHVLKLKQIRAAESLILHKINAETPTGFIYLIGQASEDDDATITCVKVGFSKDPWRRLKQLETGSPLRLYIIGRLADQLSEREREIHRILHPHRMNREWFRWSPTVKALLSDAGFRFEFPVAV